MSVADIHTGESGPVRTDVHCHACSKTFIAQLNFDLDGDHVVHCPYCDHRHYRKITQGKITETRTYNAKTAIKGTSWKTADEAGTLRQVSTAAEFLRDRWLNFGASG